MYTVRDGTLRTCAISVCVSATCIYPHAFLCELPESREGKLTLNTAGMTTHILLYMHLLKAVPCLLLADQLCHRVEL